LIIPKQSETRKFVWAQALCRQKQKKQSGKKRMGAALFCGNTQSRSHKNNIKNFIYAIKNIVQFKKLTR
jgi:hypothetical protein